VHGAESDRERAASAFGGVRVAVTRPAGDAAVFARALREAGAEPVVVPLIRIVAATDPAPLQEAARRLDAYDWIVFTSSNAVARLAAEAGTAVTRVRPRVAAVGAATAETARNAGFRVESVPQEQVGVAVAAALAAAGPLAGARVLWPRAAAARPELGEMLRAHGADVHEVVAYTTMGDESAARSLSDRVRRGEVDVLTFTSPSAIRVYSKVGGHVEPGTVVAAIGPVTAESIRIAGLPVHVQPVEHTTAAMIDALRAFFDRLPSTDVGT